MCARVQAGWPVHVCVSVLQSGIDFRWNIDEIMQLPSFFDSSLLACNCPVASVDRFAAFIENATVT